MKTRGKTKVENPDYLGGDLLDDGENTNGYTDEKVDDTIPGRSESRIARNVGNKRTGRMPRVGQTRGRNEKHYQQLIESAEFKEVVQGFIEFIEEINKSSRKKPPKKTARTKNGEARPAKPAEEPELQKKTKTELLKPLSSEKPDLQPPSPSDASKLYKFKEDANTGKGLIDLIKDKEQNMHPSSYVQAPTQELKTGPFVDLRTKEALNKPNYQGGMMDFNHFGPDSINMLLKQQANKAVAATNPYGYDNNMLKDVIQRMQMQSFNEQNPMRNYFMHPDYNYNKMVLDAFGVKPSQNEIANLQMLEALLQKNQPNLLGPLFGNNPGTAALFGDLSRELPYMMQNMNAQNQRFGNQSLGVELIQSDPEAINPKAYEGKLGRASTHVAIAYFIYFKSLDPETIAKSDKSKVDPTYNARMLKEKKYETFPPENPMIGKLLPPGFENRLSSLGIGSSLPLEYLGNPEIQRLLAQQLGISDQSREVQMQRLQQEALLRSNEELIQARGGNYQGKNNDIKLEEKDEKARRAAAANARANERGNRPTPKHNPSKEDEIIEIKENSDAEAEEAKEDMKIETKDEVKSEATEKKSSSAMQIEKPDGKGKGIDESVNAEDMVEEITELTGSGFDANKTKRGKPANIKKPVKKPSEEQQKPSPHIAPKVFAMNEEHDSGQTHAEPKSAGQGDGKGIQVISSDESPNRMQEEVEEKAEGKTSTNPQ